MKIKYPRTMHLPWSPGATSDDKMLRTDDIFIGKKIVMTEKMDGENTTLYRDGTHARSLDSKNHPSRNYVKGLHGQLGYLIPQDWRICGENLFARHSIHYTNLEDFFLCFSVWDEENNCIGWDETVLFCDKLELKTVPQLYVGMYNRQTIEDVWAEVQTPQKEGYVIRLYDQFAYNDFGKSVAKYVRENHVQTDEHWTVGPVIPNVIKN